MNTTNDLFSLVTSKQTLFQAWLKVKEKNTAGGIDHQTVNDYAVTIDKNLEELQKLLHSGKYVQLPYREVLIPKNETEKRRLGLLGVNDKIVQTAVTTIVTPHLEKSFLNVSYAYRENKGAVKAINQVKHLITNQRYTWLASCDIDNFFDTIPHEVLFGKLTAYLKSHEITELIKMFVTMGRVDKHYRWKDSKKGIPQGGVISPLLANFYLYPLDKLMVDHKYGFVRYADDFIILGHTEAEAQQALSEAIKVITEQLKLNLNEGSQVAPVENGFDFLGITFRGDKLDLSDKKFKRLTSKMAEAAGTGQGLITSKLKETIQGINAFYGQLVPQEKLALLDDQLIALLKKRWESLTNGKSKKGSFISGLQSVQFFANDHIIDKNRYINRFLNGKSEEVLSTKPYEKANPNAFNSKSAVSLRKRQYHKLEASGFDLAINQPGTMIGKTDKMVTVKKHGQLLKEVPLVNLKNITILTDGISFSSNLVLSCSENKISLDFLGKDGMPYAMLVNPGYFSADIGIAQLEAYRNGKCFELVRSIIYGKINNQINLIRYYSKYYLKRKQAFKDAFLLFTCKMEKHLTEIETLKPTDLDEFRLKVFAIEGQASSGYWDMVKMIIGSKTSFDGRERQGATDLVNSMLNYGYGMLYARVTEAILKQRLNPCLSYLHKPTGNRPSLVFDLIEEFRQQAVDRVVIALIIKNKNLKVENGFLNDHTRKLVAQKVIDRINSVEVFRKKQMRFFEIIEQQAGAIAAFAQGETTRYKPYTPKW